jgi:uncharacterized protein (TIGR02145 family)
MKEKKLKQVFAFLITVLFIQMTNAQTVTIGTQVWTTKNLNVTTFRNGDPIPQAKTDAEWKAAGENKKPAWCYYDNNAANGAKYGILYNWYAVNDPRGLAPVGFHIPTDSEWDALVTFLGGEDVAGKKMKSTSGWESYGGYKTCPNCMNWNAEYRRKVACHTCKDTRKVPAPKTPGNGSNSSGLAVLPGGSRSRGPSFASVGKTGCWWSSSEDDTSSAWYRYLNHYHGDVGRDNGGKEGGLSVRCLRD